MPVHVAIDVVLFFALNALDLSRTNWMRSPTTRGVLSASAWIALGAAASFIVQSERALTVQHAASLAFDARVHDISVALAELRTAQQAFDAPGQGYGFWASKSGELLATVTAGLTELHEKTGAADGRRSLADAQAAVTELGHVNERARKALLVDQPFSAADTVFTEGAETAKDIAAQLEAARRAERAEADVAAASSRAGQARLAGIAGGIAALVIGLLAWPPRPSHAVEPRMGSVTGPDGQPELWMRDRPSLAPRLSRETVPALRAAVDLCTDLNRARDLDDLTALLERAALAMDAAGIIVWVGRPGGSSLRPVLAHGYSTESLARMPPVSRSADNAAAAASRTGALQIVLTRPGVSSGALAAPMLSPDGCIGALTAEIKNGGETSDGVQALASIFAAQLAGLLAASVAAEDAEPSRASA